MPPRRTTAATSRPPESVAAFLAALDRPLKPVLTLVRATILGASPRIIEGIKWKAPSFRTNQVAFRAIVRRWIAQV